MYSRATEGIYIGLDQLDLGSRTVDTVIHELAHHTSGAEDLEEAHSAHMTRIAATVVELTPRGKFDELMGDVIW
jgi:23S rRNA U2552 (ribose-2'-O)-methylase RlmE/FtsJ